jgi:chromosome segregation ATPase
MKRFIPMFVGLVVAGSAGALVAAGSGANAAPAKSKATFRTALAAKLGEQLDKPSADVLKALKSAGKANAVQGGTKADRKSARKAKRQQALQQRLDALKSGKKVDKTAAAKKVRDARTAWAGAVGKSLDVDASKVTAALRTLIKQRMDSLVSQGWMSTDQENAKLACYDGSSSCKGGPGPGVAFLRVG